MRVSNFNPRVPPRIYENFRRISKSAEASLELSLRDHYFVRAPEGYLLTDRGRRDLEDHLFRRLDADRNTVVPWLDDARSLRGASILEI